MTLLLTGAGPAVDKKANLLTNGSVETDLSGWTLTTAVRSTNLVTKGRFEDGLTTGWSTTTPTAPGYGGGTPGAVLSVTTGGYIATNAMQVVTNATNQIAVLPISGLTVGHTYRLTMRLKGAVGGETTFIELGGPLGGADRTFSNVTLTTSYQEFHVDYTASATTGYIVLQPANGVTFKVDAVGVFDGTTQPYFDGDSGLGYAWTGTAYNSTSTFTPATLTRSNAWSSAGSWSARFQATPIGGESPTVDSPSFAVTAGASYAISLDYNATTITTGNIPITVHWSDGTSSTAIATVTTSGLSSPSGSVTAPAGVTSGTIRLAPSGAGTYDISVDNLYAA